MGCPPHGAQRVLAHGARVLSRRVQSSSRIQLGSGSYFAHTYFVAFVYRLPLAVGPTCALGGGGGYQHDGLLAGYWIASSIRVARRRRNRRRNVVALVRITRVALPVRHRNFLGYSLLARA